MGEPAVSDDGGASSALTRRIWRGVAMLFVALGAVGAVLPVLPTTPFLIVAAWAAGKSSPELRRRLREHPTYGPALVAWQDHRVMSRRAKLMSLSLMALSWVIVWLTAPAWWVPPVVAVTLTGVGLYLATRPEQPRATAQDR